MSRVMLAVGVAERSSIRGSAVIWEKPLDTVLPPAEGERVTVWPYDDVPWDGFTLDVADRWWATDGTVWCELQTLVVDPDELEEQMISDVRSSWHRRYEPWRTTQQVEGASPRPEPMLEAAGWTRLP